MSLYKHMSRLCVAFKELNITSIRTNSLQNDKRLNRISPSVTLLCNRFHQTFRNLNLNEFFEPKKNWGEKQVQVGRSWRTDELRIKSNSDLHKLWYVLLKERNMLLTMEHEYKERFSPMPNPERIDKVEESMKNLETVVKERNRAYYLLETGETGERHIVKDENCFGLPCTRKLREHYIEKKYNKEFRKYYNLRYKIMNYKDVDKFLRLYKEKLRLQKKRRIRRQFKHVCGLIRRFVDIDEEALKAEFPDVDLEKAKMHRDSLGHRENLY